MKRKQPQTSLEAYHSIHPQQLQDIYNKVLLALDHLGEATFEEIAAYIKVDRMQVVRRLSEMARIEIDNVQLIYKTANKKKLKSGRKGFTWMKSNPAKTQIEMKELHSTKWHIREPIVPSYVQPQIIFP